MHPTDTFRNDDRELHEAVMAAYPFALVFAPTPHGPRVAHTPVLSTGDGALQFHLARINALTEHIEGQTVLVTFNGPHGYVSPRWYDGGDKVPTWNYIALECEGRVRRMHEEGLVAFLEELGRREEARIAHGTPWNMTEIADRTWASLLPGIVGFELEIADRRETFKLSQNKPADDRAHVAAGLRAEGNRALADWIIPE